MKRLLTILLLAVVIFTACEKETSIDKPVTTNRVEFIITNMSSYNSAPVVVAYGGDFGNYQTPYNILDTIYSNPVSRHNKITRRLLKFNSEFTTDYLFIFPLDSNQQIATDESSKVIHRMVVHPSGYNIVITKTDSVNFIIKNK